MDIRLVGSLLTFNSYVIYHRADCVVYLNSTSLTCSLTNKGRVGIYGGLSGTVVAMTILRCILLYVLLLRASHILHNRMFQAILRAPVLFFDTNPIGKIYKGATIKLCILLFKGRILNRFSKDVDYLDNLLPFTLVEYVTVSIIRSKQIYNQLSIIHNLCYIATLPICCCSHYCNNSNSIHAYSSNITLGNIIDFTVVLLKNKQRHQKTRSPRYVFSLLIYSSLIVFEFLIL